MGRVAIDKDFEMDKKDGGVMKQPRQGQEVYYVPTSSVCLTDFDVNNPQIVEAFRDGHIFTDKKKAKGFGDEINRVYSSIEKDFK